jgi:hypothetical protein
VPARRELKLRTSQLVWLVVIVVTGIVVGVAVGTWWGLGAAAIVLAISEITERVQRSRAG